MDCWFSIKQNFSDGNDYVFDLENRKMISLRYGITQLVEGMIEENLTDLTTEEQYVFVQLLGRLLSVGILR